MSNPAPASTLSDGVIGADWYATHVAARLQDFFFDTAPWQRRLWDAGTVFALKELLEAARWRAEHVLSEGAVTWLARELQRITGTDPGVGDRSVKKALADELLTGVPYDTRHWRRLEQLIPGIEHGYLTRWSDTLNTAAAPGAERMARAMAAHLLDRGYSPAFLHAWIRRHVTNQHTLRDLLDDSFDLTQRPDQVYRVLLPFVSVPNQHNAEALSNWWPADRVRTWLDTFGGQGRRQPVRYLGAFAYQIEAKDPYAAAQVVAGVLERLLARASYGPDYGKMRPGGVAWVHREADTTTPSPVPTFTIRRQHRGTYVRSLMREDKVHDVGLTATPLDDALELAASLNSSSSPGPALVGGWAALESLLFSAADGQDSRDGRGVAAGDRAAALVTCSWPRAELTPLAHRHLSQHGTDELPMIGQLAADLDAQQGRAPSAEAAGTLRTALDEADSNRARCLLVLDSFQRGQRLELQDVSDVAAQERMLALAGSPRQTLGDVRLHVHHAFRRMYRYRNIVVHGGAASSRGLDVALRTVAPLAGAALDRMAHASLVEGLSPLSLAARAQLHLDLLGSSAGSTLAELLD